jgi:hypothetical protein
MATVVELPLKPYNAVVLIGSWVWGLWRLTHSATSRRKLGIHPKDLMVVSGIGCSSTCLATSTPYGFHGLHGRALRRPLA